MTSKFILAIPSKGRLQEQSHQIFAEAGIKIHRDNDRVYQGTISGITGQEHVEVRYLSASDIAKSLREGTVHFGITGEDLLRDFIANFDDKIELIKTLGFGHADIVVAVPDAWIDVEYMYDLADIAFGFKKDNQHRLRVATKYTRLTGEFFLKHNLHEYQIIQSFGATEGAPASGAAEIIVDITSSGETLKANKLRILKDGIIFKSQANLAKSKSANWDELTMNINNSIVEKIKYVNK